MNIQKYGESLVNRNLDLLKQEALNVGVHVFYQNVLNLPVGVVGYGQTPYLPLDSKIEAFNSYVITIARALAQLYPGLSNTKNVIEGIVDKLDLPLSARLIMFQARDPLNPSWRMPLLVLPVNPESFTVEYRKKSDLVYTLGGFVITHWHDDYIQITASGYIPSFKGKSKVLSSSYQYFLKFLDLYINCGKVDRIPIVYQIPLTKSTLDILNYGEIEEANKIKNKEELLSTKELQIVTTVLQNALIVLRYQDNMYPGIFTSFTIEENYELPNTLKYSFSFKAIGKINVVFGSLAEGSNPLDLLNLKSVF